MGTSQPESWTVSKAQQGPRAKHSEVAVELSRGQERTGGPELGMAAASPGLDASGAATIFGPDPSGVTTDSSRLNTSGAAEASPGPGACRASSPGLGRATVSHGSGMTMAALPLQKTGDLTDNQVDGVGNWRCSVNSSWVGQ